LTVYADETFAVIFLMAMFIFWIVGMVSRKRPPVIRLLLGCLVSSLLSLCLVLLQVLNIYINIFAAVTLIMIGVKITFGPKRVGEFVTLSVMACIVTCALGGLGFSLYYTNLPKQLEATLGLTVVRFSFLLLLASTAAFYVIIKLCLVFYNRRLVRKQVFYPMKIYCGEDSVGLTALLDTGNTLREPLSQKPVIIVEFGTVKDFMPDAFKLAFYESGEACPQAPAAGLYEPDGTDPDGAPGPAGGFAARLRMIPFASIGKENGMLIGFRPDKTEIIRENGRAAPCDVIIGIYNRKLSADGAYQCLLNPEIIAQAGMG